MTDTILVNLVSEQTIPNVQFIKWFYKKYTKNITVLFISTEAMEKRQKSECIKNALKGLQYFINYEDTILTDENDISKTENVLKYFFENHKYKNFIVNITGGTKLMSLAVYQFFHNKENTEIYYQAIGKSLQQLYPVQQKYDVFEVLTLEEYLAAHGIISRYDNNCVKDWDFNKSVYELLVNENREKIKGMNALQNNSWFKNIYKRKDFLDFTEIEDSKFAKIDNPEATKENMISLLKQFGFDVHKVMLKDIRYITGGWFEEFVYQKICNEYHNVDEKNVALNVKIQKGNDKNELDVIYLDKDNKLHVIECKSFVDGKEGEKVLNDALYKLQAIIKSKFGLYIQQHLYTKSIIDKETPLNRAKEFGIEIKDGTQIGS